jgi:hypothetical protein
MHVSGNFEAPQACGMVEYLPRDDDFVGPRHLEEAFQSLAYGFG